MKKKNYNFLKKRLAKLVRVFGLELVDQYNFTFLSNNKYLTEGLYIKNRSISIPFGEDQNAMPIGLQVMTASFEEEKLFSFAKSFKIT